MTRASLVDPMKEGAGISLEEKPKVNVALRALRHRNYRLFFIGQLISLIGTWMQMVAQPWLVYRLTGSSLLLGAIGFASQIPVFLLAFIGGGLADKYNRHRLVIATQIASMILAFVLAFLTLTGTVQIWHLFLLSALLGLVNAVDMPARQAFVVELVTKEDLMNAIALNSSVFNVARVAGPAVAGVLIAYIGEGWCFFGNGVSYIAVIAGLLMMKLGLPRQSLSKGPVLNNILEGFRYVRQSKPIRSVLLLLALTSLAGMPYTVLMPIFADKILHGGSRGLGILMGAAGLGALASAITLAMRRETHGLGKMMALACGGFGVSLLLFSLSHSFWISVLVLLPVGYSFMLQLGATNTFLQLMVPDHLRGRVMAVHTTIFMGMAPFGSLLAGFMAEHLGAPAALIFGAVGCIVGSAIFAMHAPKLQLADAKTDS
jgi:MFS family permease